SRRAEAASFASDLYWRIVIGEQESQILQREQSIISQLVVGMEQNLDAGLVNPMQLKLLQLRRMSNQSDLLELNHLLQTAVLDINRELQLDVNSQDLVFQSPKAALQVLSTELNGRDLQDWAMYVEGLARYRSAASKLESYRKSTGPRLDLVGTISQGSIAYRREDIQKAAEDKTYADWYVGLEFESTIGFDRQRRQKLASLSNQLLTETQNLERTETIFHKNIESFQSLAASLIERIDLAMTIRGENQTLLAQLEQAQRLGNVSMSQLLQFQLDAIEIEKRLIEIYRDSADLISIYRGYVSRA
ncbi:MAG: hypothetical protein HWE20_00585, partial [Gammaproteobacteria bacterium]|nr:hypothetical protein [Gammaproteobacteria bacterium]